MERVLTICLYSRLRHIIIRNFGKSSKQFICLLQLIFRSRKCWNQACCSDIPTEKCYCRAVRRPKNSKGTSSNVEGIICPPPPWLEHICKGPPAPRILQLCSRFVAESFQILHYTKLHFDKVSTSNNIVRIFSFQSKFLKSDCFK